MSLKSLPHVLDIRCVGLTVGIDLSSKLGAVGMRGFEAMERGFHDEGLMLRAVGDSLAMSPPLIVSEAQIGEIFEKTAKVIKAVRLGTSVAGMLAVGLASSAGPPAKVNQRPYRLSCGHHEQDTSFSRPAWRKPSVRFRAPS